LKMQFKKRIAYKSGPSTVLSIPVAVVRYLEQTFDRPINELEFILTINGAQMSWIPNGNRTEPKGIAGRFKGRE
jgi:hypothetical protein